MLDQIESEFFEAFRPPAKLHLDEWADQFAVLSAESSAEAGRWSTIPYQRGIMRAFTDPTIEQVSVMKSARVGYTKILNHAIGYHVHQDPCSIMMVQPTIEDAEGYSKEEIAPMIRDTPVLTALVADVKSKDSSNTILAKQYPGGTLGMVGANSPRGFRRVSRRVVLFDEVDGYPPSAGDEGDQIKLGIKRTEYFWNRKIVAGSTPTIKGASRIEKLFEQSDQRRYFVPCPQCDHPQYLKWANLKWPEGEPLKAYFVCEKNGCVIDHSKKRWMVTEADRRQLADPDCPYGWKATAQSSGKHAGFHIWAAYSFSPNAGWGQLATEFLEAKTDAETLKTFINTALGELWEEEYTAKIGAEGLQSRVETYTPGVVPAKGLVLLGAVDVQDNRFEVKLMAYGRGEESWVVYHTVINGDPAKPDIWKQLDDVICRKYRHELGGELLPYVVAIDSGGHFTHEVYGYVREKRRLAPKQFILAIKGSSQRCKPPIGKPSKQDVNYKGGSLKGGVDLYSIGTDGIKSTIYARLKFNEPGDGYIHFHSELTKEYFEQLTVEKRQVRYVKGMPVRDWVKPAGKRNEALDLMVYCHASMQFLFTRFNRRTIWEQLEERLGVKSDPATSSDDSHGHDNPDDAEKKPVQTTNPKRSIRINRRPGGYINNW
jgi:phage terminase large subunit GpA-like protein